MVSCDWLPTFLEIFKMDGYYPLSPNIRATGFCLTAILTTEATTLSSRLTHLLHMDRVILPFKLVAPPRLIPDIRGSNFDQPHLLRGARCGVVFQTLRYKPAGRGFDSRCCHWNFSVT